MGFSFSTTAYRIFGKRVKRLLPRFWDLGLNLAKSGKGVSLEMYLSTSLLASLVVAAIAFVGVYVLWILFLPSQTVFIVFDPQAVSPFKLPIYLPDPVPIGLGFSLVASVLGGISTFVVYCTLPGIMSSARSDDIDASLPYVANYMSALASSGISIERIVRSLLESPLAPAITPEIRMIVRDIDLLGMDTLTALRDVAEKTPSRHFTNTLRGLAETVKSGGDISEYLRKTAQWLVRQRMIRFKERLETISLLSEFFVTLAIAAPLFVVLLIPLMNIVGGEIVLGPIPGHLIIPVTLFGFVPFVSFVLLGLVYLVLSGE
ncbi:MAG: type II secretion system F family protein [Candidatus Bathyarchaeia archaeon]